MDQKNIENLSSDKNKIYNVNENNEHQTDRLIESNNQEQIQLEPITHLNETTGTNPTTKQQKLPSPPQQQQHSWRYKFENILDFNLKFQSALHERFYKKSYLPVTRLLFTQYLFYLIIVFITWTIYFFLNDASNSGMDAHLVKQTYLTQLYVSSNQVLNTKYIITYLICAFVVLIGFFIYLIFAEFKESQYRYLEKLLKENESSTKVDCKLAERDLKKAMQDVVEKEKEYSGLSDILSSKYANISKSRDIYAKLANPIALCVVAFMFGLCYAGFTTHLDQVSHFIMFSQCLLLFYVIYPFQMALPVFLGVLFSISFEILAYNQYAVTLAHTQSELNIYAVIKSLLHLSIHLIGAYLKLSAQAVKRDTFLKVAHMYKDHMASQQDKATTERMIKSIMPPLFTHVFGKPEEFKKSVNCMHLMRPLFIYPVSELSILFADIVGFTRMSSNKTAEELVYLLNDLYGRFDRICEKTNCEKISTLGDCYYCVSGCLNGRDDHSKCCVEMGLLMIKEIELFNKMHAVDVNMRVGVHTGNALCGFIGGKRFRFDVWSSDVTLANKMESTGKPASVHISQATYEHLKDVVSCYNIEQAEPYLGKPTYFIMRQTKKETVADALKQNSSNVSSSRIACEEIEANSVDIRISTVVAETKIENNDLSTSDEKLLILALKNAQFFQPEVNPLTMRFKSSNEEKKYQAYLMGLDDVLNSNNRRRSSDQSEFIHRNCGIMWKRPQNSFFVAILLTFIVNLCVCVAYILSLSASVQSLCISQTSFSNSTFKSDFIILLSVFFTVITIQALFLTLYFIRCCQLKEISKRKTFLFDSPLTNNNNNHTSHVKHSSSTTTAASVLNNHAGLNANPAAIMARHKSEVNKNASYVFKRYFLMHFISLIFICLTPLFIISSIYPLLSKMLKVSLTTNNPVLSNLTQACGDKNNPNELFSFNSLSLYAYFEITIVLINFCGFVQLSSLLKTIISFVFAIVFGVTSFVGVFNHLDVDHLNEQDFLRLKSLSHSNQTIEQMQSIVSFKMYTSLFLSGFLRENSLILIDLALLCGLIWLVNRQSELIQRLGFKCDQNAKKKVTYAIEQKELANWLIEVVLPSHVVSHVQAKKQYSRNYDCVGVLFVSLCNFGEFFEETYESGRELLRVLNEITVDFDRLFDEEKYANVEKIKSIGSTFMIASGLCTNSGSLTVHSDKNSNIKHLYDLIDFALELNEKLEVFNNEAMSVCHFKFKMRMGFHCGPVTAGVIGTERLLYDIWGDTVNVASRMDSTGQAGLLQTTEDAVKLLNSAYEFNLRGPVQIKGKDSMITYTMDPRLNKKINSN